MGNEKVDVRLVLSTDRESSSRPLSHVLDGGAQCSLLPARHLNLLKNSKLWSPTWNPATRNSSEVHMVGHPRCVFINYIGFINCRTQLICGRYMFITYVSTTCFGAYGHLQVDELTKTHKQYSLDLWYWGLCLYVYIGYMVIDTRWVVLYNMW